MIRCTVLLHLSMQWLIVPVPGGMSMTSTSRGAQETLVMKESRADMTMGPLQTAGASSCTAHHSLSVSTT